MAPRNLRLLLSSAVALSTAAGQGALSAGLVSGAKVRVYGVPQSDATIKAFVIAYYTGETPMT